MSGEICDNAKLLMEDTSIVLILGHLRVTSSVKNTLIQTTRCPTKLCPVCLAAVEEL